VQATTYDAFGNVESSTGSSNNAYKYAGQWGYRNDGDDGLMHVGARYYDPLVGRFISADTWLGEIGRPQSLNRYGYVEDDPVNAVDPDGHDRKIIVNGELDLKVIGNDVIVKYEDGRFHIDVPPVWDIRLGGPTQIDHWDINFTYDMIRWGSIKVQATWREEYDRGSGRDRDFRIGVVLPFGKRVRE